MIKKVGFLLLGGMHHGLHLIPAVSALQSNRNILPIVYVRTKTERLYCHDILEKLGAYNVDIQIIKPPPLLKRTLVKHRTLLSNLHLWTKLDALVLAERTSTILKYMPISRPILIHIPHGAGDRAKSYDPRIKRFDHVITAGPKDKRRMIKLKLVNEASCHVSGYIKPFAVQQMALPLPELFKIQAPTVLYNPHFDKNLSSWPFFGRELLGLFSKTPQFNFIFAPHIRLFESASKTERADLETFSQFDNIHIDLGSERSTDMSYTRAADIYLGDVSSQIYEFLSSPKPCIFIDNANRQWEDNPDFSHWKFGPICRTPDAVMSTIEGAQAAHTTYNAVQIKGISDTIGNPEWNPIERAAKFISEWVLDA